MNKLMAATLTAIATGIVLGFSGTALVGQKTMMAVGGSLFLVGGSAQIAEAISSNKRKKHP